MYSCPECGSFNFKTKGSYSTANGDLKVRCICKDCDTKYNAVAANKFSTKELKTHSKYVVTSILNNTPTNAAFLDSLKMYCTIHDAKLLVIPITYNRADIEDITYDIDDNALLFETVLIGNVRILATANIRPTIENPLAGLEPLCKGKHLLVGHPQLQLKTVPHTTANIIASTGTISEAAYTQTKVGEKANFNHAFAAQVVEIDEDGETFMRVLNADENNGFFDVDGYYTGEGFTPVARVEAIVTGDEHVMFVDHDVATATYYAPDSIVQTLKPKYIVRHDVLDCFSVSHHHAKDVFMKFHKWATNTNNIEDELVTTAQFIEVTTPKGSKNILVASNHNDHLKRWLNEVDIKTEPWNSLIYHQLMYYMLDAIKKDETIPNPFELWYKHNYKADDKTVNFVGRNDTFRIFDIVVSFHGDAGVNGSRGSLLQFSKISDKVIIGHSHSPGINKGAYQMGTSSIKNLEYVKGPSSWAHCHCIVYANGKRQLIFINKNKWRSVPKVG